MPNPSLRPYFPAAPKDGSSERLLDNQFQVELTAEQVSQVVDYLASLHQMQRDAAVAALRGRTDYGSPSDPAGVVLALLTRKESAAGAALAPADVVGADIASRAAAMARNRLLLEETAVARRRTQDAEPGGELLDEAQRALRNGMTTTGRDQQEDFRDALRLLRQTLGNPIGGRNYVTHFLTGWLLWKYEKGYADAEEAFYQAYRLSAAQGDLYHRFAARHRAYMQYLQGKPAEALETLERTLPQFPDDTEMRYDAARYAAVTGREDDAITYLGACLDAEPSRAQTVFSEPDFARIAAPLAGLVLQRTERAREEAAAALRRLAGAAAEIRAAGDSAGLTGPVIPDELAAAADAAGAVESALAGADQPAALGYRRAADDLLARVYAAARAALEEETARIDESLQRPRKRIERMVTDRKHWETTITALRREAKAGNFDLTSPPRKSLFGRRNELHESAHANYLMCRENLEQIETAMRDDLPGLEAAVAAGVARQAQIRELLATFPAA